MRTENEYQVSPPLPPKIIKVTQNLRHVNNIQEKRKMKKKVLVFQAVLYFPMPTWNALWRFRAARSDALKTRRLRAGGKLTPPLSLLCFEVAHGIYGKYHKEKTPIRKSWHVITPTNSLTFRFMRIYGICCGSGTARTAPTASDYYFLKICPSSTLHRITAVPHSWLWHYHCRVEGLLFSSCFRHWGLPLYFPKKKKTFKCLLQPFVQQLHWPFTEKKIWGWRKARARPPFFGQKWRKKNSTLLLIWTRRKELQRWEGRSLCPKHALAQQWPASHWSNVVGQRSESLLHNGATHCRISWPSVSLSEGPC